MEQDNGKIQNGISLSKLSLALIDKEILIRQNTQRLGLLSPLTQLRIEHMTFAVSKVRFVTLSLICLGTRVARGKGYVRSGKMMLESILSHAFKTFTWKYY